METQAELTVAVRIGIAALIGLAVGLERQWSGHASGPNAQFAGMRTFFALGLLGGVAGALCNAQLEILGSVVAAAGVALSVAAYVMTARRDKLDIGGTTEAAAIVVIALGIIAGVGWLSIAAGAGSILVLVLREKARLHSLVQKLGEEELRAALQFAALALVVLPLLPRGPLLGPLEIEPRSLWTVVLIFSGLNYAGYLVRRAVGPDRGYGIAGALGGLVSSTGVTLTFARHSKEEPAVAAALARGIIAACIVLPIRVLVVTAFLNTAVALALAPLLAHVAVLGGVLIILMRKKGETAADTTAQEMSPLGLVSAIQMVVVFQVAKIAIRFAHEWWGTTGIFASAAFLGLADMDALTFSTNRSEVAAVPATAAAVIATGMISNNAMKAFIAFLIGKGEVRSRAAAGLLLMAVVGGVMILLFI